MNHSEVISGLKDLGFTDKESQVYVALLSMGQGSAYAIARHSGLKKPTTYVILEQLIEKGAVQLLPKARKRIYIPFNPADLFRRARERVARAFDILPFLQSLVSSASSNVKILYFDSLEGAKEACMYRIDELNGKEIRGFFAIDEGIDDDLYKFFLHWHDVLRERKVRFRCFAPAHSSLVKYREADERMGRIVRQLPVEEYLAKSSIEITPLFVRIFMIKEKQAVIIENKEIASILGQVFEMLWRRTENTR